MNEIIFIVDEVLEGGIACSPGEQQLSLDGDLPVFHLNVTAGAEILQDNDHMGKRALFGSHHLSRAVPQGAGRGRGAH
jgi:hypothetical protein